TAYVALRLNSRSLDAVGTWTGFQFEAVSAEPPAALAQVRVWARTRAVDDRHAPARARSPRAQRGRRDWCMGAVSFGAAPPRTRNAPSAARRDHRPAQMSWPTGCPFGPLAIRKMPRPGSPQPGHGKLDVR